MSFRTSTARQRKHFWFHFTARGSCPTSPCLNALGLDRFETEDVLLKHNVTEDLGTVDDYVSDAATLAKFHTSTR